MAEETKYMSTNPGLVFGLKKILDKLVEEDGYIAKIGDTTVFYQGTVEDTLQGKRQVFQIQRKVKW